MSSLAVSSTSFSAYARSGSFLSWSYLLTPANSAYLLPCSARAKAGGVAQSRATRAKSAWRGMVILRRRDVASTGQSSQLFHLLRQPRGRFSEGAAPTAQVNQEDGRRVNLYQHGARRATIWACTKPSTTPPTWVCASNRRAWARCSRKRAWP